MKKKTVKNKAASLFAGLLLTLSLTACGNSEADAPVATPDAEGYAEGQKGAVMRSAFFDYTVNDAYLCDSYEGYTPQDGYELLAADVTVKNTFGEPLPMFDSDFQIQWNSDAEDAYDYPVTFYLEEGRDLGDKVLPAQYELEVAESRTGLLLFEVPAGETDFSISYLEYFDDDTTGDTFFVYFTAEKKDK